MSIKTGSFWVNIIREPLITQYFSPRLLAYPYFIGTAFGHKQIFWGALKAYNLLIFYAKNSLGVGVFLSIPKLLYNAPFYIFINHLHDKFTEISLNLAMNK